MQTYHPTVAEREVLRARLFDWPKFRDIVERMLERGCTLSVGQRLDTGSCYATIREKTLKWEEARGLSAWHIDVERALLGLQFALETRYEDFPDIDPVEWKDDGDW